MHHAPRGLRLTSLIARLATRAARSSALACALLATMAIGASSRMAPQDIARGTAAWQQAESIAATPYVPAASVQRTDADARAHRRAAPHLDFAPAVTASAIDVRAEVRTGVEHGRFARVDETMRARGYDATAPPSDWNRLT
jgi:hypothetical protein